MRNYGSTDSYYKYDILLECLNDECNRLSKIKEENLLHFSEKEEKIIIEIIKNHGRNYIVIKDILFSKGIYN